MEMRTQQCILPPSSGNFIAKIIKYCILYFINIINHIFLHFTFWIALFKVLHGMHNSLHHKKLTQVFKYILKIKLYNAFTQ